MTDDIINRSQVGGNSMSLGEMMDSDAPVTVIFTNAFFLAILVLIGVLACHVASGELGGEGVWVNVLISLLGGLSGWLIGTGLAPYSTEEQKRFKDISVTASAFLSGYVVSKLDRLLDATMLENAAEHVVAWERAGLFVAAFLATTITVFINRFYSKPIESKKAAESKESTTTSSSPKSPPQG